MIGLRLGVAVALALAAMAGSAAAATVFGVDCNAGKVSLNGGTGTTTGTAATVLGIVLGTESAPSTFSQPPVSGDTVEITGLCNEDVAVTVSGLTITNHSGVVAAFNVSDGVKGQLEVAGATGTVVSGILLGATSSFSFPGTKELALLYAHDGASVTLQNATVEFSPLLGVLAARSSEVAILNATVASNGGGTGDLVGRDNGGVQARDNGTVVLGLSGGTQPVSVTSHAFDAVSAYRSGTVVLYAASLSNNTGHQVNIVSASSAYITGSATTIVAQAASTVSAVQAIGTSTVRIDAAASITGASGTQAISVNEGSALLLQGSSVAAAGTGPVILASAGSVLGLAGGNTICSGTLSGSTCTPSNGEALQATRVSSLVQVNAADFGYTPAAETVTGGGGVVLQSTADLGVGFPGSVPSLSWTTGNVGISVSQNSSFRLEGGAVITGPVAISQASNGFVNFSRNPAGPAMPNMVTSVTCPFSSIPAAHLFVVSKAGTPALSPNPVLSTVFANTAANQCLAF